MCSYNIHTLSHILYAHHICLSSQHYTDQIALRKRSVQEVLDCRDTVGIMKEIDPKIKHGKKQMKSVRNKIDYTKRSLKSLRKCFKLQTIDTSH